MRLLKSPHTQLRIFNWTLFDFANTAFSVVVVTVIYSRYFTNQVAGGQRWLWGQESLWKMAWWIRLEAR